MTEVKVMTHSDENLTDCFVAYLIYKKRMEHREVEGFDVEMAVNLLEAYGIPALRKAPGDGSFGEVFLGASGFGVDIYVPETMLEDAQNIVSADIIEEEE